MSPFAELERRNMLCAAALYIGAVWALAQGIASLGPALGMPDWGTGWFVIGGVGQGMSGSFFAKCPGTGSHAVSSTP